MQLGAYGVGHGSDGDRMIALRKILAVIFEYVRAMFFAPAMLLDGFVTGLRAAQLDDEREKQRLIRELNARWNWCRRRVPPPKKKQQEKVR